MANSAYSTAQTAASAPYQYYPASLVAPLNANQNQAINTVAGANGIANPYINAASDLTSAATQPIGASQISQYMNPYISDTVNTTANEINQNNAIQQNQLQGNAASLGALGGNRVGVAQAQLANQQDLAENSTLAGLYSSGYNTALTAAQTQNSQDLQGAYEYGNLGTTAQNTALAGANAQLETGGIEQQQQQNQLNQAYSQWEGAQQYPFQTGEYLTDTANSLAGIYGGTASTTTPAPSTGSQIVGGLTTVAGLAGALKRGGAVKEKGLGDLLYFARIGKSVHDAVRSHYDAGGTIPYQTGSVPGQDLIGDTNRKGYLPQFSFNGAAHFGGPSAPTGATPGQTAAPSFTSQDGQNLSAGIGDVSQYIKGVFGPTMGDSTSDDPVVEHQGNWRGGRVGLASGGTTPGAGTTSGGLSGLSATLSGSTPTEGQSIENYQFLSPLIATGHVAAPSAEATGSAPLEEEQQEGQEIAGLGGKASGGRVRRAGGGATLPAFTPVGTVAGNAPQPATTAGTQPTSWGGVQMPTAPQLAAPQGAVPGMGSMPSLGNAADSFAQGYTGSMDPYTAYVASLPGSNPSAATAAAAASKSSTLASKGNQALENIFGTYTRNNGGRVHRDLGGDTTQPAGGLGDLAVPVTQQPLGPSPGYTAAVDHIESGGNQNATNPNSSAAGLGGITTPTMASIDPSLVQGKTSAQIAAEKATPAISDSITTQLAKQNAKYLAANNLPVNDGTLYLAHNFGAGGAHALLTGDPSASAASVLPAEDIKANPDLEGKTVGQVIESRLSEIGNAIGQHFAAPFQNTQVAQNDDQATDATPGGQAYGQGYQMGFPALPGGDQGLGQVQQRMQDQGQYNGPQYQESSVDKIANSPWAAVAAAGLGMMAGTSPFAAVNIGQGGLAGLSYLQGTQGQERANLGQKAQLAQNQQQIRMDQNQQGLLAVGAGQAGTGQQIAAGNAYRNWILSLPAAQQAAIMGNYSLGTLGLPQTGIPSPPGSADITQSPVIANPQGTQPTTVPATPSGGGLPPSTTANSGTGNSAPAPDPTVMTPSGPMSLPQAIQTAQQRSIIPNSVGTTWATWLSSYNANAARGVVQLANGQITTLPGYNATEAQNAGASALGDDQMKAFSGDVSLAANNNNAMSSLYELESSAKNAKPGPLSGNMAYVNSLGAEWGLPTATDQASAEQVANKAAGMLLASNLTNFGPSSDAKLIAAMGITPNTAMSMDGLVATGAMTAGAKLYQQRLGEAAQLWQTQGGQPTDPTNGYNKYKLDFQNKTSPMVLAIPFMPPSQFQELKSYLKTLPADQQKLINNQIAYSMQQGWLNVPTQAQQNSSP